MSRGRPPSQALLPALYPDDQALVTPRAVSRVDWIEDRLQMQEKTTQNMMDRAYKIKEDIVETLNLTHGTWQEEKRARELLQDHIRTITDVTRKLSRDIVYLEEQIKVRGGHQEGTQSAVKNLEMHHVAGVTDLRGRVARCDAAITRLSTDLKGCYDNLKSLNQQQRDQDSRSAEKLQTLDIKLSEVMGRLDKWSAQQELQMRHMETESGHQLSALDTKTRMMVEDARNSIGHFKDNETVEREKLESRIAAGIERQMQTQNHKLEKSEKRLEEAVLTLSNRLQRTEEELERERTKNAAARQVSSTITDQALETRVMSIVDGRVSKQGEDLVKLKRELREGFASVHESISNMKQVVDGKRRLLEEQLRKEIGQIRKMVVLI